MAAPCFAVLAGLTLLLESGAASATPAGYSASLPIGIDNGGGALTDYQVRLVIDTATLVTNNQLRADAADLLFTSADCNETVLPHWIESGVNTASTVVWVKVPALAATATTQIILWHGNPTATSASSARAVFIGEGANNDPISSTNRVFSGAAGGVGDSQRGFRFQAKTPILVMQLGKAEPTGTTRWITLFDGVTQAIVRQFQVAGAAGQYSYADVAQPVWLETNRDYLLQMHQATNDGYYFGNSSQIAADLTYIDMRYCNGCTQNTFPNNFLNNYHYGYPDLSYYKRNVASPEPTQSVVGSLCAPSSTCDADCSAPSCGDQYTNTAAGEECDDGNAVDTDACRNTCVNATCGDGVVRTGVEMCDDGNTVDTDACRNTCAPASCGDGVIQTGVEMCDDANAIDTDDCLSTCATATCGDGALHAGVETCDDGNAVDTDGCRNTCVPAACGDGVVRTGVEACDDGNGVETDACRSTCVAAACGDGVVRTGVETCDDGNTVDTDACPSTCAPAACGDGFVQTSVEACDDGNTVDTDACRSTCVPATCGDNVVQAGTEACDDGNTIETDDCTSGCAAARCGDGIVQTGIEECEDGNAADGDGCETDCTLTPPSSGCCAVGRGNPRDVVGFALLVLVVLAGTRRRRR